MTSLRVCLAAACIAAATAAQAQTATADGVAALAHGDIQRAVEILRPLADDWRHPDPDAAFFLATLYDSGQGLPLDPARACALYEWAAGDMNGVFSQPALTLARKTMLSRDTAQRDDCQVMAQVGLDHHFEPATFVLGPRHTIEWTLAGATITYGNDVRPFQVRLAPRGALFLPLVQTNVPTADPGSPPLHFVQLAFWGPTDNTWSLSWFLYEVSGAELNLAATESALVRTTSRERPDPGAIDLQRLVDLQLNEQGRPVYVIRSDAGGRAVPIETLAEKRAATARRDARAAADARVDWKAEQDPTRAPKMQYVDAEGCYSSFVDAWTADRAEVLTLRLGSSGQPFTSGRFEIGRAVQVDIHVYDRAVREPFCTDVVTEKPTETVWHAVRGVAIVELSPPGVVARQPNARYATIQITGAEFVTETGARVQQSLRVALTALVTNAGG